MKYILLLLILLLSLLSHGQTVVIAKMTDDAIYVGADSRAINITTLGDQYDTTLLNFCKIRKVGNYYMAVVHMFANESFEYVNMESAKAKDLNELITNYSKSFRIFLANKLAIALNTNPQYYYHSFPTDSILCYSVFFGYESDTAVLRAVTFTNKGIANNKISVKSTFYHDSTFVLGEVSEIKAITKEKETWKGDIKNTIYELIKGQCITHKITVGEPINIIKVTKNGYKWILNGCE